MKTDVEEIADLLAKAKHYAASIPEDDVRLLAVVSPINLLCEGITTAVAFVNLPDLSAVTVAEWDGKIATMLAQLDGWLVRGEAFGLAQEIGRAAARRKASSEAASKAKREDAESRTRQIAAHWNHAIAENPTWSAAAIEGSVAAKAKIKQRALQEHLAEARRLGLIPARHARKA